MTRKQPRDDVPGQYFELLDRTHVATIHLRAALGEHPVMQRHPEFQRLYDSAMESLGALYQAIGAHPKTFDGDGDRRR